jgi:hypothetical protein
MGMQDKGTSRKTPIESASVRKKTQMFFHYDFPMGAWSAKAGGRPADCDGEDGWTLIWMVFLEDGRRRRA